MPHCNVAKQLIQKQVTYITLADLGGHQFRGESIGFLRLHSPKFVEVRQKIVSQPIRLKNKAYKIIVLHELKSGDSANCAILYIVFKNTLRPLKKCVDTVGEHLQYCLLLLDHYKIFNQFCVFSIS